jgi:DnaJ-class molecular chaperone
MWPEPSSVRARSPRAVVAARSRVERVSRTDERNQMKTTTEHKPIGKAGTPAKATGVKCAFCEGTGKDPFDLLSMLSRCPVCKGHKTLEMEGPTVACAYCRGTGRQRHMRLACSGCGGAGVHALLGPTARCPQCGGSGREPEADLACSLCKGAGLLANGTTEREKTGRRQEALRQT